MTRIERMLVVLQERASQSGDEELLLFLDDMSQLLEMLSAADDEDFFGTEGWRAHFDDVDL